MLWIAHHHFQDEEPSNFTFLNHPFALNGNLYIMYLNRSDDGGYAVYRMNPTTLSVHKIRVFYENFIPQSDYISGCIVTEDSHVFIWNLKECVLYMGKEVENGLCFREFKTTGEVPRKLFGYANCLFQGSLIISGGMFYPKAANLDTFALNLKTMNWSKRQTMESDAIREERSKIDECMIGDNLLIGENMHVIGRSIRKHFILNLSNNLWTRVGDNEMPNQNSLPTSGNAFVCDGTLYLYGRKSVDEPGIVYRFDERKQRWKEVNACFSHRLPRSFDHVATVGSRLYGLKNAYLNSEVTTLVSVLEMNPNTLHRTASRLGRSRFGRSFMNKVLPESVKDQILYLDPKRRDYPLAHVFDK